MTATTSIRPQVKGKFIFLGDEKVYLRGVTYVNFPSTEYLQLPFIDFVCFNVYLEEQERFEAYLARLLAHQLGVPLRHHSPEIRYCGDFYGQTGQGEPLSEAVTVERLIDILSALPPGVTELSCHPGKGSDVDSVYRNERSQEVKVLCDPRIRAALLAQAIELRSF